MASILSMILAGGEGSRLAPLTGMRAKPAVPFGGQYRIIDFVLSNFVNSDLHKIYLITQFKSHSLSKHVQRCWRIAGLADKFIDTLPAQMNTGSDWYQGTADAVFQNLNHIKSHNPDLVCVFGGDHIYTMDVRDMVQYHQQYNADLTVAAIPVPVDKAHHFGVIEVDVDGRMVGFAEKPKKGNVKTIPGNPDFVLASMGNYVFTKECLVGELLDDHVDEGSDHDFGKDIIPSLYPRAKVMVYDFSANVVPGGKNNGYWRDVGTIDSFWEANMDLLTSAPPINLHNQDWPIRTYIPPYPPALVAFDRSERKCQINNSMVSVGCVFHNVCMHSSMVGYNVKIDENTRITESVVMPNVTIGEGVVLNRVIVDKSVEIAPGTRVGVDREEDLERFNVTDSGLVVIPRGSKVGG